MFKISENDEIKGLLWTKNGTVIKHYDFNQYYWVSEEGPRAICQPPQPQPDAICVLFMAGGN